MILYLCMVFSFICFQVQSQIEDKAHPLVQCETTKGSFTIEIFPDWAPLGAERFLALVQDEFFTNIGTSYLLTNLFPLPEKSLKLYTEQ